MTVATSAPQLSISINAALPRQSAGNPSAVQPQFEGTVPSGLEVLYFLGRGAFSEVWKVRQEMSGRVVALKRLRPEWRENVTARQLLRNEAEVGRAVKSAHVVRVHYSETSGEDPHLLLEFLEGCSLEQMLRDSERLTVRKSVWIARQCAVGLADLEQAGYAHGDLKPANVFVNPLGEVKLVDLGFARPFRLERSGTLVGTPEYMAPESLCPADVHPGQIDIYSLGVTLFRMLAGQLPFSADSAADTLQLQRSARPPQLRKLCPEAPIELVEFVGRLLAKHPLRRPENMQVVVRELLRFELAALTAPGGAA